MCKLWSQQSRNFLQRYTELAGVIVFLSYSDECNKGQSDGDARALIVASGIAAIARPVQCFPITCLSPQVQNTNLNDECHNAYVLFDLIDKHLNVKTYVARVLLHTVIVTIVALLLASCLKMGINGILLFCKIVCCLCLYFSSTYRAA